MSVDYAAKYSTVVDERFKLAAQTASAVNTDYDFVGVKTVNVYSVGVAQMNDYKRTGANRYGTPAELDQTKQELVLRKDRSFTFTIDRGNYEDAQMVNEAGKALRRQLDEVTIPEIDVYRLSVMAANAGTTSDAAAITKANAYTAFLDANAALDDEKVPMVGRVCFCSNAFYKAIKLDENFIKASDIAQNLLIKGQIGEIDGVPIVKLPKSYLPVKTDFIITIPAACCAPVKLAVYKVHEDAPGISGWLVEGRVYYDAFILNNKKKAVYRHINTALTEEEKAAEAKLASDAVDEE